MPDNARLDIASKIVMVEMKAKIAERAMPRTNGIYVGREAEKIRGAYGFMKPGYSRGILQFRQDGAAYYQGSIVFREEAVDEKVLRGVIGPSHNARHTWKMVDSTVELTSSIGLTLRAKVNAIDGLLLNHPKVTVPEQYVLIETDHQLKFW